MTKNWGDAKKLGEVMARAAVGVAAPNLTTSDQVRSAVVAEECSTGAGSCTACLDDGAFSSRDLDELLEMRRLHGDAVGRPVFPVEPAPLD